MRRLLLAGCLALALATGASTQAPSPSDEALSPMEVLFSVPTLPSAAGKPASPDATAKKPDAAKKPGEATPKAVAAKSDADGLEQCLRDWDAATHMTRQEWARTCRRVSENRKKFLREQQGK